MRETFRQGRETMHRTSRVPQVRKRTLSSVITTQLRQQVVDGTYPPGTQLNEVELASRFQTSRGPVREAMQRLVQEGLLVSHPHRGMFVPVLTYSDISDIFVARAAIERAAVIELLSHGVPARSEEHTSESSHVAISYAVFCLKKKKHHP